MIWLLLFVLVADDKYLVEKAVILVLKNGQQIKLDEPYQIDESWVVFKNAQGVELKLPVAKVDLESSEQATAKYRSEREALLNAKPKPEAKPKNIPKELYDGDRNLAPAPDKKVYRFDDGKGESAEIETYFALKAAWAHYDRVQAYLTNSLRPIEEVSRVKPLVLAYEKLIWECRASSRRPDSIDELTWEDHKRELKKQLDEAAVALTSALPPEGQL